jgi:hypothetical protein
MKQKIALLLVLTIFLSTTLLSCSNSGLDISPTQNIPSDEIVTTATAAPTETKVPFTDLATLVNDVRIVVDGKVNVLDTMLYENDWYLSQAEVEAMMGTGIDPTVENYVNLREMAEKANISYEHDAVLTAAYIWTDQPYETDDYTADDYTRGVNLDFVPEDLQADPDRQITSIEFRNMLFNMVNTLNSDEVSFFVDNVSAYEKPLLRGEGFVMAYFAATSVGANIWNNDFDNSKADGGDFWDSSYFELDELFPHIWEGPIQFANDDIEWSNYFTAAFLWSFWCSSPNSGYQVFDFDESAGSMHTSEPLTVRDAVKALVRVYDNYDVPDEFVALNDEKAVTVDSTIITDALLVKANALPEVTQDNMPVWRGFVLTDSNFEGREIETSEKDIHNIANWGFNSARLMITYKTLFDERAEAVNISKLRELDQIVAAAIKYNVHLDLLTFTLPGRWRDFDFEGYSGSFGELDLFTNPARQEEVYAIWAMLAERYKDVPSAVLSFCPIWETQNVSLSSGLPVPSYTEYDVEKVYSKVIETIKDHDPDRVVIFEPTADNPAQQILEQSDVIKESIQSNFSDVLMSVNFCENPFVYAEMTAVEGNNIDSQNHSMFKPGYPTTIYAAQYHLDRDVPFEINGVLVAGTVIDLYLSRIDGSGTLTISSENDILFSENLSTRMYQTDEPLSGYYPYAKSDKLVSIQLESDVESLQISYSGNWFEWSGIDVTLPDEYAVERWWFQSGYDSSLQGVEYVGPQLKETSTIMISPNSFGSGNSITINEDISFTSSDITAQSNKQTIESWAKTLSEFSPQLLVRYENATFNVGTIHDSALKYYDDLLSTFDTYGMGWYSNDYKNIMQTNYANYAGIEPELYKGIYIDTEMIKLMQKYQ